MPVAEPTPQQRAAHRAQGVRQGQSVGAQVRFEEGEQTVRRGPYRPRGLETADANGGTGVVPSAR